MGARPSGEWRYSARHRILGHERPGWCYPTGRCAYLPSVTCYRQSIKPPPPPPPPPPPTQALRGRARATVCSQCSGLQPSPHTARKSQKNIGRSSEPLRQRARARHRLSGRIVVPWPRTSQYLDRFEQKRANSKGFVCLNLVQRRRDEYHAGGGVGCCTCGLRSAHGAGGRRCCSASKATHLPLNAPVIELFSGV